MYSDDDDIGLTPTRVLVEEGGDQKRNEDKMIKTIPSCDVCNEDKKLQNHWWTTWVTDDGEFHSARLSEENMHNPGVKHACSAGCNGKFHARWMASGTLEMEKNIASDKTGEATEVVKRIFEEDGWRTLVPISCLPPESSHVYEGAPIK